MRPRSLCKSLISSCMVLSLSAAPLFGGVVLGGEIKQTEIDSSKQLTAANSALPFSDVLYGVMKNHPVLKQANNYLPIAKAELLVSRGAFDPSVSIYRSNKNEGSNKFYRNQNLDVYLPNYFGGGISISNPFNKTQVGEAGSLSLGAELPLLKGLITDYRRTALGKAKINVKMSLAERDQWINNLVSDVFTEYAQWLLAHESAEQIEGVLRLATERQRGLRKLYESGAGTSVDTLETFVQWQQYKAKYDLAIWKKEKQRLMLSMYLWDESGVPIEPMNTVYPTSAGLAWIDSMVSEAASYINNPQNIEILQPALRMSLLKVASQQLEFNLAKNQMLPSLNLQYGYYQPDAAWRISPSTATQSTGFGLGFQSSLFLKQQRGQYRQMQLALENAKLEVDNKQRNYSVKSSALLQEFQVQKSQFDQWLGVSENQRKLYDMEARRLEAGDVNFFVLNTREMRLLDLNLLALEYKFQYQLSGISYLHYLGWLSRN
jgi:outer membrane protein TolC